MNYQKIHDSIINRARNRTTLTESVNYHKHRVSDSEIVLLTAKEHYVVCHLKYKINNVINNIEQIVEKDYFKIASEAGKIGGAVCRDKKLGIFSPDYDIGAQSRLNWANGKFDHVDFSTVGKVGGSACRDMKAGMFREDLQHLKTEWAKIGAKALEESGNRSGIYNKEWREQHPEIVLENASKGGKKGGKTTGSMFWWNNGTVNKKAFECPDDGWVRGMLMSEKKKAQVYSKFRPNNK